MRTESLRDLLNQFPDIDGHWKFGDLPQTEIDISTLITNEAGGPKTAELLTQLARVQGLLGKLNEAGATLLLAKDLLSKDEEAGKSRAQVRFLIEQGRFFGLSMTPAQSIPHFSRAWDLAVQLEETFLSIEAAVMLSISQTPKFRNEWLHKVIELTQETKDEPAKLWLPQLYVMDGWHSFDFRKYEEALASFEKALARPRSPQDTARVQSTRWAVGRTLRALNRLTEAMEIQRALLAEMNAAGKVNGYVYLELGECLQLTQNREEAKVNFELAYKELSLNGWYSDNKSAELSRIQHLSKKK